MHSLNVGIQSRVHIYRTSGGVGTLHQPLVSIAKNAFTPSIVSVDKQVICVFHLCVRRMWVEIKSYCMMVA